MGPNPPPPEPRNRMVGSSQGRKDQFPPRTWIREELRRFGAIDTPNRWAATLTGNIHPLFQRDRWAAVSQERYDALHQSFLLSTKLLEAAEPYMCSFLPLLSRKVGPDNDRLRIVRAKPPAELDAAKAALKEIAEHVLWNEHSTMWPRHSWQGLNHLGSSDALPRDEDEDGFDDEDDNDIEQTEDDEWDDQGEEDVLSGKEHRDLTITVAGQFVDAILASEKNSEQHLTAVFAAGVNLTHEIGHTIYLHNPANEILPLWVGTYVDSELGHSLIAYLFSGWLPEPNWLDDDHEKDFYSFKTGMHWQKSFKIPITAPRGRIEYSIPVAYIQRVLDQRNWSRYDRTRANRALWALNIVLKLLHPQSPFKKGTTARRGIAMRFNYWRQLPTFGGWTEFNERQALDERGRVKPFDVIDEDWDDGLGPDGTGNGGGSDGGHDHGSNGPPPPRKRKRDDKPPNKRPSRKSPSGKKAEVIDLTLSGSDERGGNASKDDSSKKYKDKGVQTIDFSDSDEPVRKKKVKTVNLGDLPVKEQKYLRKLWGIEDVTSDGPARKEKVKTVKFGDLPVKEQKYLRKLWSIEDVTSDGPARKKKVKTVKFGDLPVKEQEYLSELWSRENGASKAKTTTTSVPARTSKERVITKRKVVKKAVEETKTTSASKILKKTQTEDVQKERKTSRKRKRDSATSSPIVATTRVTRSSKKKLEYDMTGLDTQRKLRRIRI